MNLGDLTGMLDGLTGGNFGALMSQVVLLNIIGVIACIIVVVAMYVFTAFKWQFIGRKSGIRKDWMPFVPFARTVYILGIVDEAWWKMFFLNGYVLYAYLLFTLITAISNGKGTAFAIVLICIYLVCCLAYNIYYRYKFYNAHNIKPHFSLSILVPGTSVLRLMWDCLIAFGRNYPFTGEGTSRTMMDMMDVPQERDAQGNPIALTRAISPSDQGAPWEGGKGSPAVAAVPKGVQQASGGSISGLSGMYAGQNLPLAAGDEMIIGRDNAFCNLIVDQNAEKVSRKHCGITFDPARGVYMVTDYSTNGTFLDGGNRLVANMPTTLQRGVVIALGNRENRFKLN